MIRALTGLRALAALGVVANHFEPALLTLFPVLEVVRPVLGGGWLGVEVFFVLSGFVIAHNYADQLASPDRQTLRRFWWARVARVYPVHLATLVAMVVLVLGAAATGMVLNTQTNNTVGNLVANVFLGQALPGFRGLNWPAWSVSCEAAAYLLFPLLAVGLARLSGRAALRAAAAALVAGVVGMQLYGLAMGSWAQLDYPVMWMRIAVEFTAGALLWSWWRHHARAGRHWDGVAVLCAAVTLTVLYLTGRDAPATFVVLPFIAVFVLAAASARGPVRRFLSTPALQWGGRVSYSLYMIHFFVFLVAKKLVGWDRFAGSPLPMRLFAAAAVVALILGATCATYYLVEEPGRRLVGRWAGARRVDRDIDRSGGVVATPHRDEFGLAREEARTSQAEA